MSDWRENELDAENLPLEAWERTFDADGPPDVDDYWLRQASAAEQLAAMKAWFFQRYEDPANSISWDSREGGYQYAGRGPNSADDVLRHRFAQLSREEVLEHLIADLDSRGPDWADVLQPDLYHEEPDDPPFDAGSLKDIKERFTAQLSDLLAVIQLTGPLRAQISARNMTFSAVFGCLEAYLWETAVYMVKIDEKQSRRLLSSVPELAEQKKTLAEFLNDIEKLEEMALRYLGGVVWHSWRRVVPIFKALGFTTIPSFRALVVPLETRHHIVHRGGRDFDGKPVMVDKSSILELMMAVRAIVCAIDTEARALIDKEGWTEIDLPF